MQAIVCRVASPRPRLPALREGEHQTAESNVKERRQSSTPGGLSTSAGVLHPGIDHDLASARPRHAGRYRIRGIPTKRDGQVNIGVIAWRAQRTLTIIVQPGSEPMAQAALDEASGRGVSGSAANGILRKVPRGELFVVVHQNRAILDRRSKQPRRQSGLTACIVIVAARLLHRPVARLVHGFEKRNVAECSLCEET